MGRVGPAHLTDLLAADSSKGCWTPGSRWWKEAACLNQTKPEETSRAWSLTYSHLLATIGRLGPALPAAKMTPRLHTRNRSGTPLAEWASKSSKPERIVVIGGGLSGLTAARRLHERAAGLHRPVEVIVLEAKDRPGGVIWTDRVDGFTVEGGPDSFITNKPWALDLCHRIGLGDQLIPTDPGHRRSFVVRNGRLAPIPEGFVLMAPHRLMPVLTTPVLSWRGKLRLLMDLFIPRRDEESEESLAAFVRRRLGREALDRLVQPLVGGIYTADPNELSLKATLPQFLAMEQEHRSLILAGWRASRVRRSRVW